VAAAEQARLELRKALTGDGAEAAEAIMTVTHHGVSALDEGEMVRLREVAAQLRVDSIRSSAATGSGHPTSSLSAADLLAVLISRYLRYDWRNPDDPANDHLIFSKTCPETLRRLWHADSSRHSPRAPSWLRSSSCRPPWQVMIWPKTGSTMALRRA
jgi:hypothetical protein